MSTGISRITGKRLSGVDHLHQSISVILKTRIGTRVMRRDFGSDVPNIVDNPVSNDAGSDFAFDLYEAIESALRRWERRFRLTSIAYQVTTPGVVTIDLRGVYVPDGSGVLIEGIIVR